LKIHPARNQQETTANTSGNTGTGNAWRTGFLLTKCSLILTKHLNIYKFNVYYCIACKQLKFVRIFAMFN